MADDQKPERLGGLGKTTSGRARKFAPKAPVKKAGAGDARAPGASARGGVAGSSAAASASDTDAFKELIVQSKLASQARGQRPSLPRNQKLHVSFGGASGGRPNLTHLQAPRPATGGGASGSKSGGGGGQGGGGRGGSSAAKPGMVEDPSLPGAKNYMPVLKQRKPFLDPARYHPTPLPFDADAKLYDDVDVGAARVIPEDWSCKEDPGEGNTVAMLGLQAPIEDGTTILLQLPDLLPSQALLEVAKRLQKESSAAPAAAAAGAAEQPAFLCGSECLRHLAAGKIGSLKFMKSGKIRLQLGDVEFNVFEGMPTQTRCELHWINLKTGDCVHVGPVDTRAVVALDLEQLLTRLKRCKTSD